MSTCSVVDFLFDEKPFSPYGKHDDDDSTWLTLPSRAWEEEPEEDTARLYGFNNNKYVSPLH